MSKYITVGGRFHYHNYIDFLLGRGGYEYIYSHKLGGGQERNKVNLPLKEYLVRGHLKLLGDLWRDDLFPLYHRVWELQLKNRLIDVELWHFMLHGNNPRLVSEIANQSGAVLLAEAVNTHPEHSNLIINRERELRGLAPKGMSRQEQCIIKEISFADNLLCPSSYVRKTFVDKGFDSERIFVNNFSANTERFYRNKAACAGSVVKIGYVGQIILRKGLLYLLEAVKGLGRSVELHVVGYISDEMKDLILPYRDLFHYYPAIDNDKINDFYNSIDIFVLPTLEEGLALVLCEAIAAGVPVITTEESGILDLCEHQSSVHIVRSSSAEALMEAILLLANDEEYRRQISDAGIELVKKSQTWSSYAARIIDIHDLLLRDR